MLHHTSSSRPSTIPPTFFFLPKLPHTSPTPVIPALPSRVLQEPILIYIPSRNNPAPYLLSSNSYPNPPSPSSPIIPSPTQSQQPPLPSLPRSTLILPQTPYPSRTIRPMIRTQHRTQLPRSILSREIGRLQQDISIPPPLGCVNTKNPAGDINNLRFLPAKGEKLHASRC